MTILVIGRALVGIGENFVGLLGLLEFLFRVLAVRVAVRMKFHGELAVGLLDLFIRGISCQAEDFVEIAFAHGGSDSG